MPLKIFLIGLPGSGKSTLGKQLSDVLHRPFIDLDTEIERECRMPIAEIFKSEGETWFREKEAHVLRKVSDASDEFVMATGGGTPCFYSGIDFMNSKGLSIFLDVSIDVITERINSKEKSKRPLLTQEDIDISSVIRKLLNDRLPYYLKALHRVSADDIDANTLATLIKRERT